MNTDSTRYKPLLQTTATILSLLLIVLAARGDLWLDEIWSITYSWKCNTLREIITQFRYDNNHLLNTFYLYLLDKQSSLYIYRLPAIISGIGSLYLLICIAGQKGHLEKLFVIFLAGISYPLILYFSEARGYAPAIFFALLSFLFLSKCIEKLTPTRLCIFWSAATLGFLAHLSSVTVLLSLILLSCFQIIRQPCCRHKKAADLAAIFLVPIMAVLALYMLFVRHMEIGGGPEYSYLQVLGKATTLMLGLPDGGIFNTVSSALFFITVFAATRALYRQKDPDCFFYPSILIISPSLLLITTRPEYLYFRYFIVCFPFFYLLLAYFLSHLYRSHPQTIFRGLILLVTALIVAGNLSRIVPLLVYGRGNYRQAIAFIARNSSDKILKIGSDQDFKNKTILTYYMQFFPDYRLDYINQDQWKTKQPDWLLFHSQDQQYSPYRQVRISATDLYQLQAAFRYGGISGWNWFVYQAGPYAAK